MQLALPRPLALPRRAAARNRIQARVVDAAGTERHDLVLTAIKLAADRIHSPAPEARHHATRSPAAREKGLLAFEDRIAGALVHIGESATRIHRSASDLDLVSDAFQEAFPDLDHREVLQMSREVLEDMRSVTPSDVKAMSPAFRDGPTNALSY